MVAIAGLPSHWRQHTGVKTLAGSNQSRAVRDRQQRSRQDNFLACTAGMLSALSAIQATTPLVLSAWI